MSLHLWRRLWAHYPGASRANRSAESGPWSSRPRLEALENRWLPAPWTSSLGGVVSGGVVGTTGHMGLASPGAASVGKAGTTTAPPSQVDVTVLMNADDSVYDLSKVLAGWEGWQYHDPPRIVITGNTNRALVTARLTGKDLRLSYAAGQSGTASITVSLTDAAGVSTEVTFVVTVQAPPSVGGAHMRSLKLPSTPRALSRFV